jgi:hypothetical protein
MHLFANNPQLKRESIDALIVVTQNGDEEGLAAHRRHRPGQARPADPRRRL